MQTSRKLNIRELEIEELPQAFPLVSQLRTEREKTHSFYENKANYAIISYVFQKNL